jgi:hypothetical protein
MRLWTVSQHFSRPWLARFRDGQEAAADPAGFFQPAREAARDAADVIDRLVGDNFDPAVWPAPQRDTKLRSLQGTLRGVFDDVAMDLTERKASFAARVFVPMADDDLRRGIVQVVLSVYLPPRQPNQTLVPVVFSWSNRHRNAHGSVSYRSGEATQMYCFPLGTADRPNHSGGAHEPGPLAGSSGI